MDKVTVIIPVVGTEGRDIALFENAYDSAKGQVEKIIVVGPSDAITPLKTLGTIDKNTEFIENNGETTYPAQVTLALEKVNTEWFSVLEYDDKFTPNWFKNVEKYAIDDDVIGYLPLTEVLDPETNETLSYANEAFWASSFSEEIGYLDFESLSEYLNFNTSGAVFKKKDFTQLGGLKSSMKLVFWYEFLLRALYKEKKFYVVPKVGYLHTANRKGSLTDIYKETMSEKEIEWWLELAKKEYYFPQDRHKEYEE